MVGVQMRLDHGWWMGPWVMVQYSVHVVPLLFSPVQCHPVIWSFWYFDIPLFDHPIIWSSRYSDIPYMLSQYYVVLFHVVPYHVVPLFDHPVHFSHYLSILSFISPMSSCYYVVIPSLILLLFQHPIDVLLEMKGRKTFTGMKINFRTGQCVYQYSSSCRFTYLTSFMRFCPDNQCIFWFRAGCIENTLTLLTRQSTSHHQTSLSHVLFMVQPIKYLIYLWGQASDDLCRGY